MKGKLKIYNLATIPVHLLETGGRSDSYLCVKDDTKNTASRFFLLVNVTNSGITKLGDGIPNCQINSRFPKIWGDHILANIINSLRISLKIYVLTYLGGINFSTLKENKSADIKDDVPIRCSVDPMMHDFPVRCAIPYTLIAFSKLSSLPILCEELWEGDIALVTFTVGSYPWTESEKESKYPETPNSPHRIRREGYEIALSFNIQDIVLLYHKEPTVETLEEDVNNDGTASDEQLF
ncbi:hypothetical protein M422DRAFT_274293 [Sphaerobolus stellatus SS14]|uniref:Uncharacterized protein n=1 Tax=Sphaerobolus stellatus (strain SS14) TaxID=990650 RepID=A0A0C9UI18_SPHS4|nr:hypothetical protein M422DRAFT_274293 [Sphaerobolus stellatus SS14]